MTFHLHLHLPHVNFIVIILLVPRALQNLTIEWEQAVCYEWYCLWKGRHLVIELLVELLDTYIHLP